MSQLRLGLLPFIAALLLAAPAAAKSGHRPFPLRVTVKPATGNLTVKARTRPKATCVLKVSVKARSARLPKVTAGKRGKASFRWGVPGDAPSGRWTFAVRCKRGSKSRTVKKTALVVTPANGTGLLVEQSAQSNQVPVTGNAGATTQVDLAGRGGGDPGDDYPARLKNAAQDSLVDQWGMYNRECVSFVAWALASRNGFNMPFHDNAIGWGADARARGYRVDSSPVAGSVAWSNVGKYGHVAYVQDVLGSSVHIEEYNHDGTGHYSSRTVAASAFTGYIHFADRPVGPTTTPGDQPTGFDHDGVLDLFGVNPSDAGSGKTAVHILNGATNFQNRLLSTGVDLPPSGDNWGWSVGDFNRDGVPDLFGVNPSDAGSGRTAVHILNGASNFQNRLLSTGVDLPPSGDNWGWAVG